MFLGRLHAQVKALERRAGEAGPEAVCWQPAAAAIPLLPCAFRASFVHRADFGAGTSFTSHLQYMARGSRGTNAWVEGTLNSAGGPPLFQKKLSENIRWTKSGAPFRPSILPSLVVR